MEYKLECPGFFLRTETCTGPVNRFDAAALGAGAADPRAGGTADGGICPGCWAFWQTS